MFVAKKSLEPTIGSGRNFLFSATLFLLLCSSFPSRCRRRRRRRCGCRCRCRCQALLKSWSPDGAELPIPETGWRKPELKWGKNLHMLSSTFRQPLIWINNVVEGKKPWKLQWRRRRRLSFDTEAILVPFVFLHFYCFLLLQKYLSSHSQLQMLRCLSSSSSSSFFAPISTKLQLQPSPSRTFCRLGEKIAPWLFALMTFSLLEFSGICLASYS